MSQGSRTVQDVLTKKRRKLPHWQIGGAMYFITFRLSHSPVAVAPLTAHERGCVKQAILALHDSMWHVHLLSIMPDHVHVLATPIQQRPGHWFSLAAILQRVKGGSAFAINRTRDRTGALWQKESFDRIVRDEQEYEEKARYILNNAVKAGLVEDGWAYDGFWCDVGDRAG